MTDDALPARTAAPARPGGAEPHGDREMVEGCLRGDDQAWSALTHKYRRMIYSIPFKYGGNVEDAADVFQAVCLELFNDLPNLRRVDSVQAWLMTVTAHHCLRLKKRKQALKERLQERSDADRSAQDQTLAIYAAAEREQTLRSAVDRLPPRCRQLVEQLFFEDPARPYEEVARALGLATGSIGFVRRRCLERLRGLLAEQGY